MVIEQKFWTFFHYFLFSVEYSLFPILLWEKLSNSGKVLKFKIPSFNRKVKSKVTSHNMIEREMDNRGSKSVMYKNITVKEQRVYGNYFGLVNPRLRCILRGLERDFQIKNYYVLSSTTRVNVVMGRVSNQINRSVVSYSTLTTETKKKKRRPGLARACPGQKINSNTNPAQTRKLVQYGFTIGLHKKDIAILENIQLTLGVGKIFTMGERWCTISNILYKKKQLDFKLFKLALTCIKNKEHLTSEGLKKLIAIKASMNKGLTGELKALFPDITPMTKPEPETGLIIDPHWSVGFISGEGCFSVFITKSQYTKVGYQVQLRFRFTQHIRDVELMESLVSYLGGKVAKSREAVYLNVIQFSVLTDKLLPLLEKYPIQGVKFKDYYDFIKVVELVKNKAHLTSEGLSLIRKIKAGMNTENEEYTKINIQDEVFINWFVGFSDGESNFTIILHKDSNGIIKNVAFRFIIELHVDDIDALNYIKSKLNLGNDISVYGSSCKFTVTHPKDIYKLISIFDKYNLNTTKYLDYLDFKKAFILYQEERCLSSGLGFKDKKTLIDNLLELKNGMNSKRTNFNFPVSHKINITGPWLLGLIEGEAIITCISFYYSVHPTIPYSIAPFTNYTFNTNETSSLKKSGYIKDLSKLSDVESDDGCTGSKLGVTRSDSSHPQYRVRTINLASNEILSNYLAKYPLFSSKHLNYLDFLKVLELKKANRLSPGDVNYLNNVKQIKEGMNNKRNNFGHYLAGLLEGDGHISIPALGMYAFIQSELGNTGRFQTTGRLQSRDVLRYIIGDKAGIMLFINLIHGFTEADGHFGVKYVESKAKSDTRKRSVSENISLKFRLDQRSYDKPTSSSMKPFMESLALFLSCNLKSYTNNRGSEVLSLGVSSIDGVKFLMDYFNRYPLLGDKSNDFNK
ncbi:LAGLIDADG (mitochondrion) protein [Rutstroemia sp. NJR-2017a WRK4]|nr:LAGLIDADG (mitochondrion) protein [Rutstroemia sp. NJR-2017a WRK4]